MRVAQLVRDHKITPRPNTTDKTSFCTDLAVRKALLIAKLHSETEEIARDMSDVKEYADVLEVLYALAELNGITFDQIVEAAYNKNAAVGTFKDGVFWSPE